MNKEKSIKKNFAFVNNSAETEYKALPHDVQSQFGTSLRAIQFDQEPLLPFKHIADSVGIGSIELKINGRPAYRCIYVAKYMDTVAVLHSFTKTTNHVDQQAMKTAKQRYKRWVQQVEEYKQKKKK